MRQFFATASLCQKIAEVRNYIILNKKFINTITVKIAILLKNSLPKKRDVLYAFSMRNKAVSFFFVRQFFFCKITQFLL